jgi:HNH endonuclease
MECRHLNGDRADNRLGNLRWGTRMENIADQVRHGTDPQGERNGAAKLTDRAVRSIRSMHWKFLNVLARRFGVTTLNVRAVVFGKTWGHVSDGDGGQVPARDARRGRGRRAEEPAGG